MLQSFLRMSRMMHNLQNSVNVQLQIFRVLLMTQRLRKKKRRRRKVANTAELSNVAGTISA